MKAHHNQREYSRSTVAVTATLEPENGEAFAVEVVDLSMGGMLVRSDYPLKTGLGCTIRILLGHAGHEMPIIAGAEVARSFDKGTALKFNSVALDSVAGIQGLIVDHAEHPDQAELEFSSHGGWIFNPDPALPGSTQSS